MLIPILLLLVATPAFVLVAPMLVLPTRSLRAAARNCIRSDSSFSRHRARHELRAITEVGQTMLVVLLIVMSPLVMVVLAVHCFIIPAPLAAEAVMTDFTDGEAWESNPRRGPYEDVARKHEKFVVNRGGTVEEARSIQKTLWTAAPAIIPIWLISIVCIAQWMCRLCRTSFADYHQGLRTRTLILSNKRHAAELCTRPNVMARRRYLTGA